MHVDGVTLVPARQGLCTIAGFEDGRVLVGTWKGLADTISNDAEHLLFWRQAAPCMVEHGVPNEAMSDERTRRWGRPSLAKR